MAKAVVFLSLQILTAFTMFQIAYYLLKSNDEEFTSTLLEEPRSELDTLWSNAPQLTILIRMYAGSVAEYWQIFAPSYLLFWPYKKWQNSELILIFDKESLADHQGSTTLSFLPPYPRVLFETTPPVGTTCSNWRSEGYSRQIYSNFYSDLTTDAPFIGMVDTDAFFVAKVVPADLFENGKPRILGYNFAYEGFERASMSIVPGMGPVGEFMTVNGFPFVMKREHFRPFREHVTRVYNATTFEEAFHNICATFKKYSQYDLFAHFLFYYHRDEYAWHIRDNEQAQHPSFDGRMTSDPQVLALSEPKISVMKHCGHMAHSSKFPFQFVIYDYICTAARFSERVGSCSHEPRKYQAGIRKSVEYNQLTDYLVETAFWNERSLPKDVLEIAGNRTLARRRETMPPNAKQLIRERNEILQRYDGSWDW